MARRLPKIGLKGAILGSFALVLILTLGLLFVLIPGRAEDHLLDQLTHRTEELAREAALRLTDEEQEVDPSQVLSELLLRQEIAAAAVVGPTGEVLAGTRRTGGPDPRQAASVFHARGAPRQLVVSGERWVAEPLAGTDGRYLLVATARADVDEVVASLESTFLVAFGVGGLLILFVAWLISRLYVLRPLEAMLKTASRLSEADLTGEVEVPQSHELGVLAEALNRIGHSLRDTLSRVRGVSEGVAQVIEQISRTGQTVSQGASTTLSRVEETSSSMAQMLASLRGIARNVEALYQSAEESSSSILEMAATNDEVAENVQAMAGSVEETTTAIEQMTGSMKEVARNIEALYGSTEETSSSMNEMDVSIGQVEMNANETAKLSEQVSQDAAIGVEALEKTLDGIGKILESSRTAAQVIESLGRRISEIGNILNVIDEVAEQTNLLALNAAIIAAQAGEHGKGFAVVAEEIKDLAERTGASTKEIAELVQGVQDESRKAVSAMNQGMRVVEAGVELGHEAEGALKKIHGSASKSTLMVKAIARATVEQARGSRQVTSAIQRIAETVQQLSQATNEHARGSDQIMKSAQKMKVFTAHVQRSSQEQAHGSKQITRSIESINERVTHLNRAQKEQTRGSEQVLAAVEAIKAVAEHQTHSVRQMEEAIASLQRQAEVLRSEVRRFKV